MTKKQKEFWWDNIYRLYLVAGMVAPLLQREENIKEENKEERALRVTECVGTGLLLSRAIKGIVPSKRPDSLQLNSFPSNHTTGAVCVAATNGALYPKQRPFWYAGAAIIALSRLVLRRHRGRDVLAGTLLGCGLSHLERKQKRGWLLPLLQELQRKRH